MAEHVTRWLSCDFPGCLVTFGADQYRTLTQAGPDRTYRSLRHAASVVGWDRTAEGDDLCKRHADAHRGRTVQPALFAVKEPT